MQKYRGKTDEVELKGNVFIAYYSFNKHALNTFYFLCLPAEDTVTKDAILIELIEDR